MGLGWRKLDFISQTGVGLPNEEDSLSSIKDVQHR